METPDVFCYGRGDRVPATHVTINTTSKSAEEWSRAFSPFYLGPCVVTPWEGGPAVEAKIMENAWQYSKVYGDQCDEEGAPCAVWRAWSAQGFASPVAARFPRGRGAKPLYSLHQGRRLGYVQARMELYAPLYEQCVRTHAAESYNTLKNMAQRGDKLALFDYDGYCEWLAWLDLAGVMFNTRRKMGHSFVLRGMLQEDLARVPAVWRGQYEHAREIAVPVPRLR